MMPFLFLTLVCIVLANIFPSLHALSSVFLPMPQGYYAMHYLRPRDDYQRRCQQPWLIAATGAYHQSYRDTDIARSLFNTPQLTWAGSEIANRQPCWLLADDVGLAPDFLGTITFHPSMKHLSLDLFYHLNLTSWCDQLFIELGTTLVNERWNLCAQEQIIQPGAFLFPPCDMSATIAAPTARTIKQALSGCFFFGDMQVPWNAGRFIFETQELTRLADISIALGLDLYQSDGWTLSGAILTLVPTGNKYNSTHIFSPLVGNGDHWELGITIQTRGNYQCEDEQACTFFASATVTHQFQNIQRRTFDFLGLGPLSRYLLLEKFVKNADNTFSYSGVLSNAVNFTTRAAFVRLPLHGDLVLDCAYQNHGYLCEAGYHFYGRACEHVRLVRSDIPCDVQGAFYVLKGTQPVCDIPSPTSSLPGMLTSALLDLNSGSAPTTYINTLYFQTGYQWESSCMTPAMLMGVEGSIGSYGHQKSLCQWGFWIQFNARF